MPTPNKLALVKQLIQAAKNNLDTANQLLTAMGAPESAAVHTPTAPAQHVGGSVQHTDQGAVIIEGVFDGQNMVGPDGKLYSVPANYASKSKLVEGDLLKLTISPDGSFIYKQIGPVERDRIVGVLVKDSESEDFRVMAQGRFYKVLLASITYFKSEVGDEVVILVPKGTASTWAAVENVIKKGEGDAAAIVAAMPALTPAGTQAPVAKVPAPKVEIKAKTETLKTETHKVVKLAATKPVVEKSIDTAKSSAVKVEVLPSLEI
ncbi:MAG: hypothetical protein HY973_03610 [Candidatus Kerfeldbacteria bacterium]|nr:hypothetical protein [Candidatus Kerfeldbacteria bacterium]